MIYKKNTLSNINCIYDYKKKMPFYIYQQLQLLILSNTFILIS